MVYGRILVCNSSESKLFTKQRMHRAYSHTQFIELEHFVKRWNTCIRCLWWWRSETVFVIYDVSGLSSEVHVRYCYFRGQGNSLFLRRSLCVGHTSWAGFDVGTFDNNSKKIASKWTLKVQCHAFLCHWYSADLHLAKMQTSYSEIIIKHRGRYLTSFAAISPTLILASRLSLWRTN